MIEKNVVQKVLQVFLKSPSASFHLRQLSRLLRKSLPTIMSATDALASEKLIIKTKGKVVTTLRANKESDYFIRWKRIHNLELIYESGILDFLIWKYNHPQTIVVFGSFSRGEDIETSDVDIAVNTGKKLKLDLSAYEHSLKRRISMHEIVFSRQGKEFKASLMNGIVMEGSW